MRFLTRSLIGLSLFLITLTCLVYSVLLFISAFDDKSGNAYKKSRKSKERSFSVYVDTLESINVSPKILSYGEVISRKSLEIRAPSSGQLQSVSQRFQDGDNVSEGSKLFTIDPQAAIDFLAVSKIDKEDTEAELVEAKANYDLAVLDLVSAKTKLNFQLNSLKRQRKLAANGIVSESAIEISELSFSDYEQNLEVKKNAVSRSKARIGKLQILLKRNEISLTQAIRNLKETDYFSPFSGVLANVTAAPGRLVNRNEKLGVLIDPNALEVKFEVSATELERITDQAGQLLPLLINAQLELDNEVKSFKGKLERVGAIVSDGSTGREIFSSLSLDDKKILRPGDFLLIEIEENALEDVSLIPSEALNLNQELLILDKNDRLRSSKVSVLRLQGNYTIVSGAQIGEEYVIQRSPKLTDGLKVKPIRNDSATAKNLSANSKTQNDTSVKDDGKKFIKLNEKKRQEFISFIKSNSRMPRDVKDKILKELKGKEISEKTLRRLEKRMSGG